MMMRVQSGIQKPNQKYMFQLSAQPLVATRSTKALEDSHSKDAMVSKYNALLNNNQRSHLLDF